MKDINLGAVEFLLQECGEEIGLMKLCFIVDDLYDDDSIESFNLLADELNTISNKFPITVNFMLETLSKCHMSVSKSIDPKQVYEMIIPFSHFMSGKEVGSFLKYVFSKYKTIEEITSAKVSDVGLYHQAKFQILQKTLLN